MVIFWFSTHLLLQVSKGRLSSLLTTHNLFSKARFLKSAVSVSGSLVSWGLFLICWWYWSNYSDSWLDGLQLCSFSRYPPFPIVYIQPAPIIYLTMRAPENIWGWAPPISIPFYISDIFSIKIIINEYSIGEKIWIGYHHLLKAESEHFFWNILECGFIWIVYVCTFFFFLHSPYSTPSHLPSLYGISEVQRKKRLSLGPLHYLMGFKGSAMVQEKFI